MVSGENSTMHSTFSDHWLVQGLSAAGRDALYALGESVSVEPDQVLIEADKPNDALYVLLDGAFRVSVPKRPGREGRGTLGHRGPGDLLGEYSFIDASTPTARVTASTAGQALRIPHEALARLIENDVAISAVVHRNLLRYLINRLRSQDDELDCLML